MKTQKTAFLLVLMGFLVLKMSANVCGQAFKANPQPFTKIPPHDPLPIGAQAPDFRLPATDGKWYSLKDFAKAKALVVVFTCNHCPTAQAYEDRLIAVTNDYKAKGVAVVAISPNSPISLLYEELGYTDLNDDYEAMKIRVKDKKYNFPYLYDGDTEAVSVKYGPVATPHVFVFDTQRILQYHGRIDASEKPGTANAEDLRTALDAVLAGQKPAVQTTKVFGCSTKWGWKTEFKEQIEAEWATKPVTLQEIDEAGIKNLLANKTDKLLLVNVWATWCGPCVVEYPAFVTMQRMYGARDFEFVSITADKLANKEKALNFLKKKTSAVRNYIFSGKDAYALIEAIDPAWNGALPYTMLIEPGGKVFYKIQGSIKPLELRKIIVEHPKIGRYF
jgi:peroxiredoxin